MQYPRHAAHAVFYAFVAFFVLSATPAWGHSALTGSTPRDGARLESVPSSVEVDYSEPPTTDVRFTVTDGCDRDVARSVEVLNQTITADVSSGQPGGWTVEWAVVSAVDGHLTRDEVSFAVRGDADCDLAAEDDPPEEEESQGASFPIVAVGVATVLIIGVALVLRLRSN